LEHREFRDKSFSSDGNFEGKEEVTWILKLEEKVIERSIYLGPRNMKEIIQLITGKPDWEKKIFDVEILAKWKQELAQQGLNNPKIVDKIFQLLQNSAKSRNADHFDNYGWHLRTVVNAKEIWRYFDCKCQCLICSGHEDLHEAIRDDKDPEQIKEYKRLKKIKCRCVNNKFYFRHTLPFLRKQLSHKMNLIPVSLKSRFQAHVADYERRKGRIDYHPGSNNQMNDIIHPSLYCFVKDTSPVNLSSANKAAVEKTALFQWIPSEFEVIRNVTSVRTVIHSPINNLDRNDPLNEPLYNDIAEIFTLFVPKFEHTIRQLVKDKRLMAPSMSLGQRFPVLSKIKGFVTTLWSSFWDKNENEEEKEVKDQQEQSMDIEEGEGNQPTPQTEINEQFLLSRCQVIVKIARCEVSAASPTFSEGSWHLEGIPSEKIIATGIYYYSQKNVEKSFLKFRATLDDPYDLDYEQDHQEWVSRHYGFKFLKKPKFDVREFVPIMKLGKIQTKENFCLVFPNFLQHRVSPIVYKPPSSSSEVMMHKKNEEKDWVTNMDVDNEDNNNNNQEEEEDEGKGHRSILVFFLIDPRERILCTADIPPQQQEQVIGLEEAKVYQELLMFERKYEYDEQSDFFQRVFSLCEH
jgi:hypothetical protein